MFSLTMPTEIEETLYEGLLEPRFKSDTTRGGTQQEREVDEQSRPYVKIGMPQWYDIVEWFRQEGKNLPATIATQQQDTSFFLVRFSCSLRPRDNIHAQITWARFDAELYPAHTAALPIALDLHPRYVKKEKASPVHIVLLPSLQFKEVEYPSLDESVLNVSYNELFPMIIADGVNNLFSWEMIATNSYPLHGIRSFNAFVKVPRQANGVQAILKLTTDVTTYLGPRRMSLPRAKGPEQAQHLSCLICAPNSYPASLQVPIASSYCQVVILTAQSTEYKAIRAHLADLEEVVDQDGTIYERGKFIFGQRFWDVAIVETGEGNAVAAAATERAMRYFKPTKVLFIGVAGGLKDVKVGDVVASTKVYGYEAGKAEATFKLRPEVFNATYRIVQRARVEARKDDWLQRIKMPRSGTVPKAYVAPIAAGEKVIASARSTTSKFLHENYGDALAVEMEGYGFMEAIHIHQALEALVIRGISNVLDDEMKADTRNAREIAAQHASAFAFELLAKLGEAEETH